MNKITYITKILLLILVIPFSSAKKYTYNFEISGKSGINSSGSRHIAQVGLLYPLSSQDKYIVYSPIFLTRDNHTSFEFNLGLGLRIKQSKSVVQGGYIFYDYRKNENDRYYKQLTFGYEYLTKKTDFRVNIYLPESKTFRNETPIKDSDIAASFDGHRTAYRFNREADVYTESPSKGIDIEYGLHSNNKLSGYIAYYGFDDIKKFTHGIRTRAEYRLTPWCSINSEINLDTARSFTLYGGLKLNYPFQKTKSSTLDKKMTSLPVRDIDIRTSENIDESVKYVVDVLIDGYAPFIDAKAHADDPTNSIIYKDMNSLLAATRGTRYYDIVTVNDDLFTKISDFQRNILALPGSNAYDILSKLILSSDFKSILKATANSPLNTLADSGYWTNKTEMDFFNEALAYYQKRYRSYEVSDSEFERAFQEGTYIQTAYLALQTELKNRDDVYVALNNTFFDFPESLSVMEMSRIREESEGKRYIAMHWLMTRHTTGLIIDNTERKIIYMGFLN